MPTSRRVGLQFIVVARDGRRLNDNVALADILFAVPSLSCVASHATYLIAVYHVGVSGRIIFVPWVVHLELGVFVDLEQLGKNVAAKSTSPMNSVAHVADSLTKSSTVSCKVTARANPKGHSIWPRTSG